MPEQKIIISPIGDIDNRLIHPIMSSISRTFMYPVDVRSVIDNVDFALDSNRKQYYSTPILEKLAGQMTDNEIKIVAITNVDLFIPILTYVFGEAQLGGKSCIVSTYRLKEDVTQVTDDEKLYYRIAKEAIHELGHTFKLRHCKDHSCIMHYCRGLKDVDLKSDRLCRYCRIMVNDEKRRIATKAQRH